MELIEFGLQSLIRINEALHVRHVDLINFILVDILCYLSVLVSKEVLRQIGGPEVSLGLSLSLLLLLPSLLPFLLLKLLGVNLFLHFPLRYELMQELLGPKPEVHQHRVNCAESHAKVLLVESYWDVFVDSVADVSHHELLESHRFELYLFLDVLQRILKRKLLGAAVI